jgi:hypothetical protein
MEIEYNWTITRMQVYEKYNDKQNVVCQVYYTLEGINTETSEIAHSTGDVVLPLNQDNEDNEFIDLNNLTEEIILSWVLSNLGEYGVNNHKTDIENKLTVKKKEIQLPWIQNTDLQ